MKSLFDTAPYHEILERINQLNENTNPQWGKMNVGLMLKHCQYPLDVANGKLILKEKPHPIKKMMFKLFKSQMYNDKTWKQNLPTVQDFRVNSFDSFEEEKTRLLNVISEFHKKDLNLHWPDHPFFGHFTTEQWGKMQYKHMDHHLRQFGV